MKSVLLLLGLLLLSGVLVSAGWWGKSYSGIQNLQRISSEVGWKMMQ